MDHAKIKETTVITNDQSRFTLGKGFGSSHFDFDIILLLEHMLTEEPKGTGNVAIEGKEEWTGN